MARQFERSNVLDALKMLIVTGAQMQNASDTLTPDQISALGKRVENHARHAIDYLDFLANMGWDPN